MPIDISFELNSDTNNIVSLKKKEWITRVIQSKEEDILKSLRDDPSDSNECLVDSF